MNHYDLSRDVPETEQPPPPPYTPKAVVEPADPDAFLERCVDATRGRDIAVERELASLETEKARVRNLFLFTLCCDYQCGPVISLSAPDRRHFINLCSMLEDLRNAHSKATPTHADSQKLAPFFWKFLHQPCSALGIPFDLLVICISRLKKFTNVFGRYRGCCSGLLASNGLDMLARKIEFDTWTIVPAVTEDGPVRAEMLRGISKLSGLYFEKIRGFEDSTMVVDGPVYHCEFGQHDSISYDATDRGLEADRLWKAKTTSSSLSLSIQHFTQMASEALAGMVQGGQQGHGGGQGAGK